MLPSVLGWRASPDAESLEDMEDEAEDLRLKLEALRAADYREQLRASCVATAARGPRSEAGAAAEHFRLDDDATPEAQDLAAMYDFSGSFGHSGGATSSCTVPTDCGIAGGDPVAEALSRQKAEAAASKRLRVLEAKLKEQEEAMGSHAEAQERKLAAASRALQRMKSQVQQLTAQLGLKELRSTRLDAQVGQLRNLLVEKERRLQEALDEASLAKSAVLSIGSSGPASGTPPSPTGASRSVELSNTVCEDDEHSVGQVAGQDTGQEAQQPQEPPVGPPTPTPSVSSAGRRTPAVVADEEQLMQLSRITEELADALQTAKASEEETARELETTALRLEEEQAERRRKEQELVELRAIQDAHATEAAVLRARLEEQERCLEGERKRVRDLEERANRADLEERLQVALAARGRKERFHPHLEV